MSALPDPRLPWAIPMAAVALIAEAEGCRLRAYRCQAGVPTIGWGRTTGVQMGMTCTQEQADDWLCREIAARVELVQQVLTAHAEPNQLGALVSLHYNIGEEGFRKSTVLRAHNAGDSQAAARAFGLWNKFRPRKGAPLEVSPGLTARRAREAALYLTPEPDEQQQRMPQAVEPESKLTASPILQSGATVAGAGVLLSDVPAQIGPVREALGAVKSLLVDTLGVPTDWLLPTMLVLVGCVVIWQRVKQRRAGWA